MISLTRLLRSEFQRVSPQTWGLASLLFAVTLSVWIGVLLMAHGTHWFGVEWLRIAWVIFDAIMVGVFLLSAYGAYRRAWFVADLAATALGAVIADWILTVVHAIAFHVGQPRHPLETVVSLVAISGPTLAVAFFWILYLASSSWRTEAEAEGTV
jgi:hypothetical protein